MAKAEFRELLEFKVVSDCSGKGSGLGRKLFVARRKRLNSAEHNSEEHLEALIRYREIALIEFHIFLDFDIRKDIAEAATY